MLQAELNNIKKKKPLSILAFEIERTVSTMFLYILL